MRLHYRDFMSLASIAMVVLVAAITSRSASDTCFYVLVCSCSGCDWVRWVAGMIGGMVYLGGVTVVFFFVGKKWEGREAHRFVLI